VSATKVASPAAGGVVPLDPVRALQHTLYRTAKADSGRRFHALGDKIIRSDVLWRAWFQVYRNQGAPGVDRTTLEQVKEYGVTRLLDEVASELREGRYRPLPARRVFIPKPGPPSSVRCRFPRCVTASCRPRPRSCSSRSSRRTCATARSGFDPSAQPMTGCRSSSMKRGGDGGGWWRRISPTVSRRFRMSG